MSLTCHSSMTVSKMTIIIYFRFFIFKVSLIFSISFILIDAANITEISSYSKVSRNGPELISNFKSSSENSDNQGRSFQASPVYIASKVSQLKNGEAFDYPSTQRYSTLDEDLLAHYDDKKIHKEAQDRFRPPPKFASSNTVRQKIIPDAPSSGNSPGPPGSMPAASSSSGDYTTLPKQVLASDYNYATARPMKDDDTPSFTVDSYSPDDSYSQKPVGPYAPIKTPYQGPDNLPSYLEKFPPKSQFPSYVDTAFPHDHEHFPHDHEHFHYDHDDGDDDDDHNFHHDVIYDHPPDHYEHHHPMMMTTTTTTTEEPDTNDQRLSKRPYSYYYLGKKLWYLPLYFSIYFIIYIAALVLKSIARHKINFPNTLAHLADSRSIRNSPSWWDLTKRVLEAIDHFSID